MPESKITYSSIGNLRAELKSELVDNKPMDTRITLEAGTLCYVSGAELDAFMYEINAIITKYRI